MHYRRCVAAEVKAGAIRGRAIENCAHNHGAPIVYHLQKQSYIAGYIAVTAIIIILVAATFYVVIRRKASNAS